MRGKRLLPLVALLIILIIAVVVLKRPPSPPNLSEEVGLERLVPASLRAENISGIDLYQGDKAETAVRLRRQNETWVVSSHHDAPVKADKINTFLDTLSTLAGEFRSDKAELLGDFRLDDKQALHLLLYTTESETPAVHLLAGKGSGRNGFMRLADKPRVYSVNLHVQNEAGMTGSDTEQAPEAKPWLDLQIQDIPQAQIMEVALQMPTRRVQFTLEKPAAAPPTSEPTAPQATEATPPAKPQWKLVQPEVDYAVKQGAVESLVSTLGNLRGEDIVAPDQAAAYGLDTPSHRAVLTIQPEGKDVQEVFLAVGNEVPEQAGKRYARLGQSGPIYILPAWASNQIFPHLGKLLSIDMWRISPEKVTRIAWQRQQQSWILERQTPASPAATEETTPASSWRFVDAETPVDAEAVTALLEMSKAFTADDWFADPAGATGLEQPTLSFTLTLPDGQSKHLVFGNPVGAEENRYASLQGAPGTFVIAAATYKSLTEALDKLQSSAPSAAVTEPKKP